MSRTTFTMLMVIVLFLAFQMTSFAGYRQVGGYVYEGESRFVDNVWNFVKKFSPAVNSYEAGKHNWDRGQYYYCQTFQFDSLHHLRVDAMDFAYYSGHGNNWYCGMRPGEGVSLKNCPGYGDLPNNGDLEFIVFQSCAVVPSPLEYADWWSNWLRNASGKHIFQGLHQAIGYRTNSWSGNGISNNFGNRVRCGQPVWQSWFNAVNDERSWWKGDLYPGMASVVLYPGLDNDTIYYYGADPPMNHGSLRIYYQH